MKLNTSIVYFLTRGLFFGFGIKLTFYQGGRDSYIGAILGTLIGLIITSIYSYIIENKKHMTLKELLKKHRIVGLITRILMLIASIIILIYTLVIYQVFVGGFLLINTPELFVLIPLGILVLMLTFKGLKVINRVSNCLLPLSLILLVFSILSLVGYFETINFMPILNTPPSNLFKSALTFAGISVLPNILTLHLKDNIKGYTKFYLLSCLSLIIVLICINGVFGEELVKVFRFPEYMVLKQLKILNFIEKVENILSIAWAFDLFMTSTMAVYSIKELVPEKKKKYTTSIILFIILFIISKAFAGNYVNELRIYYILPYISLILPIIIIIPMIYLIKKKQNSN